MQPTFTRASLNATEPFRSARIILGGVELMHMIRKGQMRDDGRGLSAACSTILHAGGSNTYRIAHQEARLCSLLSLGRRLTRQNPIRSDHPIPCGPVRGAASHVGLVRQRRGIKLVEMKLAQPAERYVQKHRVHIRPVTKPVRTGITRPDRQRETGQ